MPSAIITGTGMYVPPRVVKNEELKEWYDTSDEWITERSGIKERRWIEEGTNTSALAVEAASMALKNSGLDKDALDMVVFATLTPDAYFPGSGCFLQAKMGLPTIPCLDIRMQCSGFIYGLSLTEMYIKAGKYKNILVVGAEVQSTAIDYRPEGRTVGVLFGDGAGAVVVQASDDDSRGILSTYLGTEGQFAEKLWIEEPTPSRIPRSNPEGEGIYTYMEGRHVFKNAVTRMSESVQNALDENGWTAADVDLFIPHQANLRIAEAVAKQMGVSMDKFFMNIQKYGNTTAATLPICLHEAQAEGRLKPGDKVVLTAFGSGYTWGSAAVVW